MTPPYTTGLKLSVDANTGVWKDAGKTTAATLAGDLVYTWADLSGNGFDLIQATSTNRPTFQPAVQNTLPVIRFPSGGVFANLGTTAISLSSQAQSVFIAFRPTQRGATQTIFSQQTQNTYFYQGLFTVYDGTNTRAAPSGSVGPLRDFQLLTVLYDTTSISFRLNGGGTGFTGAALQAAAAAITTCLVGSAGAGATFFNGDIGEVLAYNAVLSGTNLTNVENYLLNKWGVNPAFDKHLPLKVIEGDSISANITLTSNDYEFGAITARAIAQAVTIQTRNFAVSGSQVSDLTNRATAVDALFSASRTKNVLNVFAGTNDLANGGLTPAAAYANLVTYCQARQATGWKVIVWTMLPRATYSETNRQTFNASIRSNWPTFANALNDVGADAILGAAGAQNNTALFQTDTIHPTNYGQAILAAYDLTQTVNFTQTVAALAGGLNPKGVTYMRRRSITEYASEAAALTALQSPGVQPHACSVTADITDSTKFRIYSDDTQGCDAVNAALIAASQPAFWEVTPTS